VLQIGLSPEVSSTGFEALSELHNLEKFIFGNCMDRCEWKLESKFLLLCAKILPHLKAAGRLFDFLDAEDLYNFGFNCNRGYHNEMLQNLQEPATLGLQLLSLR
jgi:hypothetical protein